jgi:ribosomal protein S18 acetylase RimI-like enzyme
MEFTIRLATKKDLPEMRRLWREMMDVHARCEPRFRPLPPPEGERAWEQHMREDVLGNEECCIFVAEAEGRLIGQMMGMLHDPYPVFEPGRYGYVTDVAVDPAARRSGVGRALFEALKAWFRAQGVTYLQLMVAHHNPISQAFWRALGCTDYMDIMWYNLEAK